MNAVNISEVSGNIVAVKLEAEVVLPLAKEARKLQGLGEEAELSPLDIAVIYRAWLAGFAELHRALALEMNGPPLSEESSIAPYMQALERAFEPEDELDDAPKPDLDALEEEALGAVRRDELWFDNEAVDTTDWKPKPATQDFRDAWVRANNPTNGQRGRTKAFRAFLTEFHSRVTKAGNPSQQRKQFGIRMAPSAACVRLEHVASLAATDDLDENAAEDVVEAEEPAKQSEAVNISANPSDRIEVLNPNELTVHPLHDEIFGTPSEEEMLPLQESIAAVGIKRPITATGDGCASARGTVLEGRRRRACAIKIELTEVPVRVIDGLSREEEENLLLRSNLLDEQGRTINEVQRYEIEWRLMEIHGKTQGQRTDLKGTSLTSRGSDRHAEETVAIIAREVGATPSAVSDRRTVFGSLACTDALRDALANGKVKRSAAARIVRKVEKAHKLNGGGSVGDQVLQLARAEVDAWVHDRTNKGSSRRKTASVQQEAICFRLDAPDGGTRWEGQVGSHQVEVLLIDGAIVVRWGTKAAKADETGGQPAENGVEA